MLVDTSVWIAVFSRRDPLDMEAVVDMDEIVVCLPIVQEVLQGFRNEQAFRRSLDAMLALPIVESPLHPDVFLHAADLFRRGRASGQTVRSSVDCLIAACALKHDLEVLHRDRDFAALARISGLRQRQV